MSTLAPETTEQETLLAYMRFVSPADRRRLNDDERRRTRFEVGQRVYWDMYGNGHGIVTAIDGEQLCSTAESFFRGALIRIQGRQALFTVAFHSGHLAQGVDEQCLRTNPQWQVLAGKAGEQEIEVARNHCKATAAKEAAEREAAAKRRARERAELPARHPTLLPKPAGGLDERGRHISDAAWGAKNIRIQLAAAFPGVKFSVRSSVYSGGDSIDIKWTDGPAVKDVEAITGWYQEGHFDGMQDIYETNYDNVWPSVFGGARYVTEQRTLSGETRAALAAVVLKTYGHPPELTWDSPWPWDGGTCCTVGEMAMRDYGHQSIPAGHRITGGRWDQESNAHLLTTEPISTSEPKPPISAPPITDSSASPDMRFNVFSSSLTAAQRTEVTLSTSGPMVAARRRKAGAPAPGPAAPKVGRPLPPSRPNPPTSAIADTLSKIPAVTLRFLRNTADPEQTRADLLAAAVANPAIADWRKLLPLLDVATTEAPASSPPSPVESPAVQSRTGPAVMFRMVSGPFAGITPPAPPPLPEAGNRPDADQEHEPAVPALDEEACLARCFHGIDGAAGRWAARRETGLSDRDLLEAVRYEFGEHFGWGEHGAGMWDCTGGTTPRIRRSLGGQQTVWKGAEVLAIARRVLGIPVATVTAVR